MTVKTFEDLINLLKQENLPFVAHTDTQIAEITVANGPLQTEMVIRWEMRLLLIQVVVAFPYKVPTERIPLVEHAIALINHRLIMPGFFIDHDNRLLYFRLVVPRGDDGSMTYDQIFKLVSAAIDTMLDFFNLLVGVVSEGKDPVPLLAELAPRLKVPAPADDPVGGEATAEISLKAAEAADSAASAEPAAQDEGTEATQAIPPPPLETGTKN